MYNITKEGIILDMYYGTSKPTLDDLSVKVKINESTPTFQVEEFFSS